MVRLSVLVPEKSNDLVLLVAKGTLVLNPPVLEVTV